MLAQHPKRVLQLEDPPAVLATPSVDPRLLALARRERVQSFFARVCATTPCRIELLALDETPALTAATPNADLNTAAASATLPVLLAHSPIAAVRVASANGDPHHLAAMIAPWLEEVLALEHDVDSLTHAVVHSYEELHLLYELGGALGGVLNVEQACRLIVNALPNALGAAHATISLLRHGMEQVIAHARNRELNATVDMQARATATLQVNGEAIGRVAVQGKLNAAEFGSNDLKLLDGVAALAAPAIRNAQLYEAARAQADTDALTQVGNHRRLQERLDEEIERAQRYDHPLTVIMVDLDNFKLFNDLHGHLIGDRVLQSVARALRVSVRVTDYVGRYGGDEFMLVLPETDSSGAMELAQRILDEVAAQDIVVNGERLPLGISLGVASLPANARSKHELLAHADTALYESKHSGGRTVRMAHAPRKDWLSLQSNNFGVLEGLVQTVDAKDHYTRAHSETVTDAALLLAQRLNLSDETRRALRIAGLLHDVGKVGIPDSVLKKPGKLTLEEYEIMKQHVQLSEMIIKGVPHLNDVLDAVAHHHERFDGKGYPYGKSGEQIPLLGRIMSIADAYSAMCVDRPYRRGRDWPEVRAELERGAGTQFDPELVHVFIVLIEELQTSTSAASRANIGTGRQSTPDAAPEQHGTSDQSFAPAA